MAVNHDSLAVTSRIKPPTRKSRVETYLWDRADGNAEEVAETLQNAEKPLSPTVVLIPVAGEQEAGSIAKALAGYANQKDNDPFTVALLVNYRADISDARLIEVAKTLNEIDRVKNKYKNRLDVRVATLGYDDPTIGHIRKDLWDGALILAHSEGMFDDPSGELIGINHDIDTEDMSPHYISNIQQAYRREQQFIDECDYSGTVMLPYHTYVRHALPTATHPNTAKGIYFTDFSMDQAASHYGYEEGTTIPFTRYATVGGFDKNNSTYETKPFINGLGKVATIDGTHMLTSPRRYISRFPEHGYKGIWQPGTFGDKDECREQIGRDATPEELEQHVKESLEDHVYVCYFRPAIDQFFLSPVLVDVQRDASGHNMAASNKTNIVEERFKEVLAARLNLARFALQKIGLTHLEVDLPKPTDVLEEYGDLIRARLLQ